jgi:glycosyltransferase involved in cell wall biosynthesis
VRQRRVGAREQQLTTMRIAYVAPFDLLQPAGHVAHVLGALRELARQTSKVTLFAVTCPDELRDSLEFVAVPTLPKAGLQSVSFGLGSAAALGRHLLQRRTDLVYTRYFKSVLAPIAVAKAAHVPVVVEVNSSLSNERRNGGVGALLAGIEEAEERAVMRAVAGSVAVTKAIELELRRRHPAASFASAVVENGVDTSIYQPLDRDACCRAFGLSPVASYVVFAGALQVWQGVLDLLRAVATAREAVPNLQLLVVGDGPERARMQRLIEELRLSACVKLCGFQSEATVARYIGCADVCVAPYNTDAVDDAEPDKRRYGARMRGSPLKLMTYMACARAIVTTHLAEAGAYLAERQLGVAVPPEDPESLAAALVALLGDRPRREAMAERALEVARREHGWGAAVAAYLRLAERARIAASSR